MFKWILLASLALAATIHAEDYCFGFLNSHPERKPIPEAEGEEIQKGHLAHMGRMAAAGHLLAAGPMLTPGGPRGIVLYRCTTTDEAIEWTSHDPAVQNKRLTLEVYRWRGPDAIGEPLASKLKADPNTKYNMVKLPLIVFKKTDKWVGSGPLPVMKEHAKRISELLQKGTLRMAGPFVDADGKAGLLPGMLGLLVASAISLDDAKALAEQDPYVRDGYATFDSHLWMVADEAIPARKP